MSRPVSIAISLLLLATFAVTALVVGRPTLPLFNKLPPNIAAGLIAYQNNDCVFVADLERATVSESFCLPPQDENGRHTFTEDGKILIGTWDSDTGVLVDPVSGLTEGERAWGDYTAYPEDPHSLDWHEETQSDGLLVTIDGQEYLLTDAPNAYRINEITFSADGVWGAAQDNVGQLVLLGPSGPWLVDTDLDNYTWIWWVPER